MECVVPLSPRFKIALGLVLGVSLGLKLLVFGAGVMNPSEPDIASALKPFFERQGYSVVSAEFAGRSALLAVRNECMMYVVPIAHQGWHQSTVRQAVGRNQTLWFAFEGNLSRDAQQRWRPLLTYYSTKIWAYVGANAGYPVALAIVAYDGCDVTQVDWRETPSVPYQRMRLGSQP